MAELGVLPALAGDPGTPLVPGLIVSLLTLGAIVELDGYCELTVSVLLVRLQAQRISASGMTRVSLGQVVAVYGVVLGIDLN